MNFFRRKALTEPRDASLHFTFHCGGKSYVAPRVDCPHQRILFVTGLIHAGAVVLTPERLQAACAEIGWMFVSGDMEQGGGECLDVLCPSCGIDLVDQMRRTAVAAGAGDKSIAKLRALRERLEQGLLDTEAFERACRAEANGKSEGDA